MALHIDRVDTEVNLTGGPGGSPDPRPGMPARLPPEDERLMERIRPMVMAIISEELERYLRRVGR